MLEERVGDAPLAVVAFQGGGFLVQADDATESGVVVTANEADRIADFEVLARVAAGRRFLWRFAVEDLDRVRIGCPEIDRGIWDAAPTRVLVGVVDGQIPVA